MKRAEFDQYAKHYRDLHRANIAITGEDPDYFARYKVLDLVKETRNMNIKKILDFGCGIGNSLPVLAELFPKSEVIGADVSSASLEMASELTDEKVSLLKLEDPPYPIKDETFDLILVSCVFHHIPHEKHASIIAELYRTLSPNGLLAIFEHNPWNPLTVNAVNTCQFDVNAVLLSAKKAKKALKALPFNDVKVRYRIFFPHALRWLRFFERWLVHLPLGAQYYVIGRK